MKAIAESLAVNVRYEYRDLVEPTHDEELSGDEVALRVIRKLRLEVGINGNGPDVAESDTIT